MSLSIVIPLSPSVSIYISSHHVDHHVAKDNWYQRLLVSTIVKGTLARDFGLPFYFIKSKLLVFAITVEGGPRK
jgi:hypothetical protein